VPFYSMVNLVAGRRIVPELMQDQASGENLAAEAIRLLEDARVRNEMKQGLAEVSSRLGSSEHPMDRAARIVSDQLKRSAVKI
jgi:lipid-A-disaccharide synthase